MVYRVGVQHISAFLQDVDIFRGLSERHLHRIAAVSKESTFSTGDYLGIQNEPGSELYVIRRGRVTVTTGSDDAKIVVRTVTERETVPVAVLFEPPLMVTTAAGGDRRRRYRNAKGRADGAVRHRACHRGAHLQSRLQRRGEQVPLRAEPPGRHGWRAGAALSTVERGGGFSLGRPSDRRDDEKGTDGAQPSGTEAWEDKSIPRDRLCGRNLMSVITFGALAGGGARALGHWLPKSLGPTTWTA